MKQYLPITLALFSAIGIGAAAFHSPHAQSRPLVYYVSENELTNPEGYMKEYGPHQAELVKQNGGRYLVAGGRTTSFEGAAPASRIVIIAWD
jgi:hypothetical protein